MRRRLVCVLPAMALVAVAAGGCVRSGSTAALVIGAIYPITGPQAPGGIEEARGVDFAVESDQRPRRREGPRARAGRP